MPSCLAVSLHRRSFSSPSLLMPSTSLLSLVLLHLPAPARGWLMSDLVLLKEGLGVNSPLECLPLSESRVTVSHWVWDHRHLGPFGTPWREADHIDPWCLLMGAAVGQHSAFSVKTVRPPYLKGIHTQRQLFLFASTVTCPPF